MGKYTLALLNIKKRAKPSFYKVGLIGLSFIMVGYLSYSGYQEIEKFKQKVTENFTITKQKIK